MQLERNAEESRRLFESATQKYEEEQQEIFAALNKSEQNQDSFRQDVKLEIENLRSLQTELFGEMNQISAQLGKVFETVNNTQ